MRGRSDGLDCPRSAWATPGMGGRAPAQLCGVPVGWARGRRGWCWRLTLAAAGQSWGSSTWCLQQVERSALGVVHVGAVAREEGVGGGPGFACPCFGACPCVAALERAIRPGRTAASFAVARNTADGGRGDNGSVVRASTLRPVRIAMRTAASPATLPQIAGAALTSFGSVTGGLVAGLLELPISGGVAGLSP